MQPRKSNNLSPIVDALAACNLAFLPTLLKPFLYYEAYQLESRHILLLLQSASILGIENINSFSCDFVCSTTKRKIHQFRHVLIQCSNKMAGALFEGIECKMVIQLTTSSREPSLTSPWLQLLQSFISPIGPRVCACVTLVNFVYFYVLSGSWKELEKSYRATSN